MIARTAPIAGVLLLLMGSGLNSTITFLSHRSVIRELSPDPIQQPTYSTRVEAVRVDVLVAQEGRPVTGLKAADFELLDNGVPQKIDVVDVEQLPVDLVLGFDVSASVAGARLGQLRSASDVLLDEMRATDRVALVTFNHVVRLRSDLTSVADGIRAALEQEKAEGATALYDGTYLALMTAGDRAARRLQIIFSDGIDTGSWLSADAVIQAARRSGVVAYAVAVAEPGKAPAFLKYLCDATGGRLMEVESTWNLSSVFLDVLDEFRQRYVLSYTPAQVSRDGWHRLEVRLKGRKAAVKARPGYFGG